MSAMLPVMRELCPDPVEEVDPSAVYAADVRAPHADGRPWLLVNMISSIDGATALDGRSGALGGPADKKVFGAIRAAADVILVGAGTVRAEGYGPPSSGARLAIVSGRVDLDPTARLFTEARPDRRPWLVTTAQADTSRLRAVVDDVIVAGDDRVDAARAIAELAARGARVVLCEGGPSLNGQLIAAGDVDELCLTLAPLLVVGDSARIAHGPVAAPVGMQLDRVLEQDGYLFLRYIRNSTQ
jgi:riboflavin biosynthesis pyrimidine reductase